MPAEKRSLRSNKPDESDKQKPRSNSSTSNSKKDKPTATRSTSSRSKPISKKGVTTLTGDMSDDKPHLNGKDKDESSPNGTEDVEMREDKKPSKSKVVKGKDEDDEMTVVVPPSKSSNLAGASQKDSQGDVAMNGGTEAEGAAVDEPEIDPREKAITSKHLSHSALTPIQI
jgi:26S proteasome regulatory subunit N3